MSGFVVRKMSPSMDAIERGWYPLAFVATFDAPLRDYALRRMSALGLISTDDIRRVYAQEETRRAEPPGGSRQSSTGC